MERKPTKNNYGPRKNLRVPVWGHRTPWVVTCSIGNGWGCSHAPCGACGKYALSMKHVRSSGQNGQASLEPLRNPKEPEAHWVGNKLVGSMREKSEESLDNSQVAKRQLGSDFDSLQAWRPESPTIDVLMSADPSGMVEMTGARV